MFATHRLWHAGPAIETTPRIWERRWAGILVVLVVAVVYAPTLVFTTVQFDDHWLWASDSPLRALSWDVLANIFTELDAKARHPLGGEYLPIRDLAVALDLAVWGENEYGPHATQLLLVLATTYGTGRLLIRFGMTPAVAWIGTLFWSLHPLRVESVSWLSERKGVLAGLFVVACGHAWVRFRGGGSRWWLAAACVTAIAATWSKAPALVAPAVFACWDLLVLPPHRRRWVTIGSVVGAAALAAIPVLYIAYSARVIGDVQQELAGQLPSAIGSLGHYAKGLFLVEPPSLAYPIQTAGPAVGDLVAGAAAIAGAAAFGWLAWRRRWRWGLAWLAWGAIWFLPISHLVLRVHIIVADRYVYMWSAAACMGVAFLVERLRGVARLAVTGALICVLGIASLRAEVAWTSSIELFARAFDRNPDDPQACENLATALAFDGQIAKALGVVDRGLASRPDHPYLLLKKASLLDAVRRRDEALEVSRRAAETGKASAMWAYSTRLRRTGDHERALAWAVRAAERRPEVDVYQRGRVDLLMKLDRYVEAERFARALVARPEPYPIDLLLLARTLAGQGRSAEARQLLVEVERSHLFATEVAELRAQIDLRPIDHGAP